VGQDGQDRKGQDPAELTAERQFDWLQSQDIRNERRIFWSEVAIILVVALLVAAYFVALSVRLGTAPLPRL
jgi:hypothetical protein